MKKQRKLNLRKINVATIGNLMNILGGQTGPGQTNPNDPSAICDTVADCITQNANNTCDVTKRTAFSNLFQECKVLPTC